MTPESQLASFIDKFDPARKDLIHSCRKRMDVRFPDAVQLVYDNYNFLVIGFGPTLRPSDAIFSLAAQKRGIVLCFLQRGPELPDPAHLLRGNGVRVRNLPLAAADDFDRPEIQALVDVAAQMATIPMAASVGRQLVIRSISAKQRPRR